VKQYLTQDKSADLARLDAFVAFDRGAGDEARDLVSKPGAPHE